MNQCRPEAIRGARAAQGTGPLGGAMNSRPSCSLFSQKGVPERSNETKRDLLGFLPILIVLAATVGACSNDHNPVYPVNHRPIMLSLTALPTSIGPSDSVLVTCSAMDPDGDKLVFDWFAHPRLHIQGAILGDPFLYESTNSRLLYQDLNQTFVDTAWVRCQARDHRGGGATRRIPIILRP